jgi:hypothetical protein
MQQRNDIELYVKQKLAELEKEKDMSDAIYRGRFSFGIDSRTYGHLPSWKQLLQKKKNLIRWIWIDSFLLSFLGIGLVGGVFDSFDQHTVGSIVRWIFLSVCAMLLYVISSYHMLFIKFRETEREVRKLIYQDLLQQLRSEKTPAEIM